MLKRTVRGKVLTFFFSLRILDWCFGSDGACSAWLFSFDVVMANLWMAPAGFTLRKVHRGGSLYFLCRLLFIRLLIWSDWGSAAFLFLHKQISCREIRKPGRPRVLISFSFPKASVHMKGKSYCRRYVSVLYM